MKDYNFLDANTFIGRSGKREAMAFETKTELLADMDYYRLNEAIVTHISAKDYYPSYGNGVLMQELQGEDRLTGCWVMPSYPRPDEPPLEQMVDDALTAGIRIVRIYPPIRTPEVVGPWLGHEIFRKLEAHRIPVLLSESDIGSWPDKSHNGYRANAVYELCKTFPNLPIIIVRFNYQLIQVAFAIMKECANFHIEISNYTTHRGVEVVADAFGSQRIIYGSGMPYQNPGSSLAILRFAAISDAQKQEIAGDNLRRLMSEVI